MRFLLLLVLALYVTAEKKADKEEKKADLSHGFRTEIDWVKFDHAIGIAKDLNKPIFLLIHKTWCGACKGLKREFNTNPKMGDLIELSKKFVMINTEDDEEPEDAKYAPDGGYIPRILFLDTDGEVLSTKNDKHYPNNAYFYPLVNQVVDAMERALKEFSELGTKEAADAEDSKGEKAEDSPEEIKEDAEEEEETEEEVEEEEEEKPKEEKKKAEKHPNGKPYDNSKKKDEKKEEKDEL